MASPTRLIFIEGIPGSGKSTMARRVADFIGEQGQKAEAHREGCDGHPLDLTWHAYYARDEYHRLLRAHPEQAGALAQRAIIDDQDGYALIAYRGNSGKTDLFSGELQEALAAREFCYARTPAVPLEAYRAILVRHWRRFARERAMTEGIDVVDGAFFQHQIHDIQRIYAPERDVILDHLAALLAEVAPLRPIVFYITQQSVRASLERIARTRERPEYASEASVAYWEARKRIEYAAMARLPLRSYAIDNTDCDWHLVFEIIARILSA